MKRVTVLGGSGFLGRKTALALKRVPGVDVSVASRRAKVKIDVRDPETFVALEATDVLVDLSNATRHAPDELIAWCLQRGITVLEATSDAPCVERLSRRFSGQTEGLLVLGGGIFTGVSNLLGRAVAASVAGVETLSLGISSSPFSGAGAGTIELMLAAMAGAVPRYQDGRRIDDPGLSAGPELVFSDGPRATLRIPFAETFMLHSSTGAPKVDVYFAPRPALLVPAFRAMPQWALKSPWVRALMRAYFTVLRRGLLRAMPSAVELVARADGGARGIERRVLAGDGMAAAAWAIAATVEALLESKEHGVRFIDDLCALDEVVTRANALSGQRMLVVSEAPLSSEDRKSA